MSGPVALANRRHCLPVSRCTHQQMGPPDGGRRSWRLPRLYPGAASCYSPPRMAKSSSHSQATNLRASFEHEEMSQAESAPCTSFGRLIAVCDNVGYGSLERGSDLPATAARTGSGWECPQVVTLRRTRLIHDRLHLPLQTASEPPPSTGRLGKWGRDSSCTFTLETPS